MDTIHIEGLQGLARVGVPLEERRHPQKILIDLEMGMDLAAAGRSDAVERTIDYARVVEEICRLLKGRSFRLVEALAHQMARRLITRFGPDQVVVRVKKFSVPGTKSVGVEIKRGEIPKVGRSRTTSKSPRTSLR